MRDIKRYKNTVLLLVVMALLQACSNGNKDNKEETKPLHDSIAEGLRQMDWDKCTAMLADGEKAASTDMERLDVMLLRTRVYYYFGKASEMRSLLDSIAPAMERLENGNKEAQGLYMRYLQSWQVYYAQYSSSIDSTIIYGKRAKDYAIRIGDNRNAIQSISNLADAYRQNGEVIPALQEYDRGIRLNDSLHADSALYLPMYSGMACTYNVLRNRKMAEIALEHMLEFGRYMTLIDSVSYFNMKGNALYYDVDYEGSLRAFLQYDSLLKTHPDMQFERVICDVNLADNYIHLKQDKDCGQMLQRATDFFTQNGITAYLPYIHTLEILNEDNHADGKPCLLVDKYMDDLPLMQPDHKVERLRAIIQCRDKSGRKAEALEYGRQYTRLKDSLRNALVMAQAREIEKRYEHDMDIAEHEEMLREKELTVVRLWMIILAGTLVIVLLCVIYMHNKRRNRRMYERAINQIVTLRGKIIQNKLRPHFISNALALGHDLTDEDLDNVILLIRKTLEYEDGLAVPLRMEIDMTKAYLRVSRTIISGQLVEDVDIDETIDLDSIKVPSLWLVTVAENAIKHGQRDDENHIVVKFRIYRRGGDVVIDVENYGQLPAEGIDLYNMEHGLGLVNRTIQLLCLKRRCSYHFTMSNTDNGTVKATLVCKVPQPPAFVGRQNAGEYFRG